MRLISAGSAVRVRPPAPAFAHACASRSVSFGLAGHAKAVTPTRRQARRRAAVDRLSTGSSHDQSRRAGSPVRRAANGCGRPAPASSPRYPAAAIRWRWCYLLLRARRGRPRRAGRPRPPQSSAAPRRGAGRSVLPRAGRRGRRAVRRRARRRRGRGRHRRARRRRWPPAQVRYAFFEQVRTAARRRGRGGRAHPRRSGRDGAAAPAARRRHARAARRAAVARPAWCGRC